jgi:hypothetical protein
LPPRRALPAAVATATLDCDTDPSEGREAVTATVIALTTRTSTTAAAVGGWTAVRHEVIERASGRCGLCGRHSADTAFRRWEADDLVAAHTSCVVGLGPPARLRDAA